MHIADYIIFMFHNHKEMYCSNILIQVISDVMSDQVFLDQQTTTSLNNEWRSKTSWGPFN